jgi:hypothetical protein
VSRGATDSHENLRAVGAFQHAIGVTSSVRMMWLENLSGSQPGSADAQGINSRQGHIGSLRLRRRKGWLEPAVRFVR